MRISDWSSDVCSSDLFKAAMRAFEVERVGILQALRGNEMTAQEANDRYREIRGGNLLYSVNGKEKSANVGTLLKQCMRSEMWRDDDRTDFMGFERRLKDTRDALDRTLATQGAAMPDDPFAPASQEDAAAQIGRAAGRDRVEQD